jgi:hypothetical protein
MPPHASTCNRASMVVVPWPLHPLQTSLPDGTSMPARRRVHVAPCCAIRARLRGLCATTHRIRGFDARRRLTVCHGLRHLEALIPIVEAASGYTSRAALPATNVVSLWRHSPCSSPVTRIPEWKNSKETPQSFPGDECRAHERLYLGFISNND